MHTTPSVDLNLPVPAWFQLHEILKKQIADGRFGPDHRLPTEAELCETYGLSRTPVRQALRELTSSGQIVRHRRKGTFVSPAWHSHGSKTDLRLLIPSIDWIDGAELGAFELDVLNVPLTDMLTSLIRQIGEGSAPDVALVDGVWVRELASNGFVYALDELDPEWCNSRFEGGFRDIAKFSIGSGGVWAVPAELDVSGIWHHRSIPTPTNWAELREATKRFGPISLPYGDAAGEAAPHALLSVMASNGAAAIRGDSIEITEPASVNAMDFIGEMARHGQIRNDTPLRDVDVVREVVTGRAAFGLGASYQIRHFSRALGSDLSGVLEEYCFAPVPHGPASSGMSLVGGMSWVVPRQASAPDAAMAFIRHMSEPGALAQMSRRSGQIPPDHASLQMVSEPFVQRTAKMLSCSLARPMTNAYPRVSAQLGAVLEQLVLPPFADVRSVAARAADRVQAITGLSLKREPSDS